MRRFALLAVLACGVVHASDTPTGSAFDGRIQAVAYNPGQVVLLRTVAGSALRVVFGPDETIQDVAAGFGQGWEFQDRKNILFVKARSVKVSNEQPPMSPKPGKWNTNLLVTTNRRLYDFDLVLLPEGQDVGLAYRVEFRYPQDEAESVDIRTRKEELTRMLDGKPPVRNRKYTMRVGKHSREIAPTEAYDDGRFTYLRFPNNRDFPAIFLVKPDKSESIVNTHIDPNAPEVLVVHRVARAFVLRHGNSVVGVYNDAYDPDGVPPEHGTTVPNVKRVVKSDGEEP